MKERKRKRETEKGRKETKKEVGKKEGKSSGKKMIQNNHQQKFRKLYRPCSITLGTSVKSRPWLSFLTLPLARTAVGEVLISTTPHQGLNPTKPQTNQINIPTLEQVPTLLSYFQLRQKQLVSIWSPQERRFLSQRPDPEKITAKESESALRQKLSSMSREVISCI